MMSCLASSWTAAPLREMSGIRAREPSDRASKIRLSHYPSATLLFVLRYLD